MITQQCSTSALLCALLLLTACVSKPVVETHQGTVPPLTAAPWRVSGKALVSSASGRDTVNLNWQRLSPKRDQLGISGPLGMGNIRLERDGTEIVWRDNGRTRPLHELGLTASSWSAIQTLPLHQTGDWLIGHLQPKAKGWLVDVIEWQLVNGWRVPRKLTMKHDKYMVTLLLLDWQLTAL